MVITRLTPHFAARIDGVDITRPLEDRTWKDIRAALDEHSVLVFCGQPLDDDTQTAFSRRFGSLEVTRSINPAADTRSAYPSLPDALKQRAETAIAVHDFSWSRDQIRPGFFTEKERAEYPPVRHPVVRTNLVNGRKALFLGAHASHIVGMPVEDGRARLKELLEHVTQPEFRYRHEWQEGDLVIWDNRCVVHRATPFDSSRHKRFMQRTTVGGDPAEFASGGV